jgi:hypothetical protein
MARYKGVIGVKQEAVETSPGIFEESIIELPVTGEMRRQSLRWLSGELSQDKVNAGHQLSIIASEASITGMMDVVYITWQGKKWVVKTIEYQRPRINLTLGGIYNG